MEVTFSLFTSCIMIITHQASGSQLGTDCLASGGNGATGADTLFLRPGSEEVLLTPSGERPQVLLTTWQCTEQVMTMKNCLRCQ